MIRFPALFLALAGTLAAAPIDLPDPAKSVFPTDVGNNPPKLAQASIGQNDVQASPLMMALAVRRSRT